jgi:predicted SAM-dependent methyltransferase
MESPDYSVTRRAAGIHKSVKACEVCGSITAAQHSAREMMFGFKDQFVYHECLGCGRLRLPSIPDLSRYYPGDYYSLVAGGTLKEYIKFSALRLGIVTNLFVHHIIKLAGLKRHMRILDVGGGDGSLVRDLRACGYTRAMSIDPFLSKETSYSKRAPLSDMQGPWDRIMFNHSLEHIDDQAQALRDSSRHLSNEGKIIVRVPVVNWAWRHYGVNWVQLDCPRHIAVHTPVSMSKMAASAGLAIESVIYDSTALQFWGSELYISGIPLVQGQKNLKTHFKKEQLNKFEQEAALLNQEGKGDQAAFLLTRHR